MPDLTEEQLERWSALPGYADAAGPFDRPRFWNDSHLALPLAIAEIRRLREIEHPRLLRLDEYHEDFGSVLWWKLPIVEPPFCGSPLDSDWPDYHTHWTRIPVPKEPPP